MIKLEDNFETRTVSKLRAGAKINFNLNNTNEFLGQILREWRHKKRLSLEELSRETGGEVSARHLRRIEAGQVSATYDTFFHIRQGLRVTTSEMFLPYFIFENQVPLFHGRPNLKSNLLAIQFTPGSTCSKYQIEDDPDCYAIQLQEDYGLIGTGSILHMSPKGSLSEDCLVLAMRKDGMARLYRWDAKKETHHRNEFRFVHRVIQILPR